MGEGRHFGWGSHGSRKLEMRLDWHFLFAGTDFHPHPLPPYTHLSPLLNKFIRGFVSLSQAYCASKRTPPRCKTFQLPNTTLKVGDPGASGRAGEAGRAPSLLIMCLHAPSEECRKKAGKDFAKYFSVEYKNQTPMCISPCESGFNASMNCNFGKCMLERSGPRC